jgi:NADPH:quinone reductase-like Zn-dependent oxidoreductase
MRAYQLTGSDKPRLEIVEREDPTPAPGQVVVDLRATSLNYRDLLQAKVDRGLIPLSDGAGVVSAVGPAAGPWSVGDRVMIGFMPGWTEGPFTAAKQATALGGAGVDGVLTERVSVTTSALARVPDGMTFEEASTLPCAGVTAWSALFERRPVQPGETVLLLGTGGVSIFALQLAKVAGARVIITSSSDEKLARARALGADVLINYRTRPGWSADVLSHTEGLGADLAVDVGGPGTLNETLKAVRHGGRISMMGVLTGFDGPIATVDILVKRITLQGIYVGPVETLRSLAKIGIRPVIDRVFPFLQAEDAYSMLAAGEHFGKIVIQTSN